MNLDEKYHAWKERPMPLNIPPDFAGDVMRQIYRQTEQGQKNKLKRADLVIFFQRNCLLQFAVIAVAAIVGLSRFWLMFFIILEP